MHELLAKARQVAAAEKTADGLVRLEAKVDRLLAHLNVPEALDETPAVVETPPEAAEPQAIEAPAEEHDEPRHRNRKK